MGFFGGIALIAMTDCIDHGFADRQFHPVREVFREAVLPGSVGNETLNLVQRLERAGHCKLEAPGCFESHRSLGNTRYFQLSIACYSNRMESCLLYTSDAADERSSV